MPITSPFPRRIIEKAIDIFQILFQVRPITLTRQQPIFRAGALNRLIVPVAQRFLTSGVVHRRCKIIKDTTETIAIFRTVCLADKRILRVPRKTEVVEHPYMVAHLHNAVYVAIALVRKAIVITLLDNLCLRQLIGSTRRGCCRRQLSGRGIFCRRRLIQPERRDSPPFCFFFKIFALLVQIGYNRFHHTRIAFRIRYDGIRHPRLVALECSRLIVTRLRLAFTKGIYIQIVAFVKRFFQFRNDLFPIVVHYDFRLEHVRVVHVKRRL